MVSEEQVVENTEPSEEDLDETTAGANEAVPEAEREDESEAEAEEPLSLEEQLAQAQAQAAEYLDGWQRARAELVNYKKRVERERAEMRELARVTVIGRFLDVLDDLQRALESAPESLDGDEWFQGLTLIQRKFGGLLEAEGVTVIDPEGEQFDPALHEAITQEESDDHEEGQIIEVIQKGYKLGDRVVRPARVRVAG